MDDVYIGQMLDNRYEILEKIGSGGMAVVYKARCHRLNRFVAIKILKSDLAQDAELRRRFHAESQAVAMLSHPNIVAVYDVSHSDNIDYIVMELIEGITLKQYINRKGILNWKEALHFTTQIAKALSHAHSRGIIHRDIKPHNIMILKDGSVKVADFGIARLLSTQNTLTQETLGSVHYISPEQAKGGAVDARSDIYSVGVVMYEMLTSRLPFEGDSAVSIAIQHISSIPLMPREINPDIPIGLENITMHAMEPNLDLRYPSADALLADLEEFRKNPSIIFSYSSAPLIKDDDLDNTKVISTAALSQTHKSELTVKKKTGNAISRDHNTSEDYRNNRKRANRTTTLIGVFCIILFLLGLVWFMWNYAIKDWLDPDDERISVTNFVGMYVDDVINNSEYTQFYNFTVNEVNNDDYSEGYILSQDPSADRSIAASASGVDVTLTVSAGKEIVLMPDFYNRDYRDANRELEYLQLDLKIELKDVPSEDVTKGYVVEQYPEPNTELISGMTVEIYYSTGPDIVNVEVPKVVGLTEQQAIIRLQSYDLTYDIDYVNSDEYPEGYVIYQSMPEGEQVPIHTKIILQISLGPEESTVPNQVTPDPPVPPVNNSEPTEPSTPIDPQPSDEPNNTDTPNSDPEVETPDYNDDNDEEELGAEDEGITPNG